MKFQTVNLISMSYLFIYLFLLIYLYMFVGIYIHIYIYIYKRICFKQKERVFANILNVSFETKLE